MLSDSTLASLVWDARRFGNKIAIVSGNVSLSYRALEDRVARVAGALAAAGVGAGTVVTLHGPSCWQWIVAYHGAARLGAVVNPVNALLTADEVVYIIGDCGARLVIADAERLAALAPVTECPGLSFDDVAALGETAEPAPPATPLSDDLATICYTSGTTGRPKGAMLTHRNIVMNAALTALMHGRCAEDVTLTALPLAHVYGNVVMNGTLMTGGTL
ncbi:MAG: AMP-binding protein, partial [Sphingopyxis sp.]|nr:AMP-binding protein [Sphingopyxis sp.]